MAIKDSIINQVLKSEANIKSSQMLYKRLREIPSNNKDSANPVEPGLTGFNRVQPGSTELNPVKTDLENPVKPTLTGLNMVSSNIINPIKPGLTQFKNLHGNPQKVLEFLSISLLDFQQLITIQISMSKIAECTYLSRDSVKSALKYLIKNEIIKRIDFFAGIHGWAQYSIEKNAYISVQNIIQTGLNRVIKTGSNNSSNNKIITTEEEGDEWSQIDVSPLEHKGLHKNSLLQLKNKNSSDIVQQSIYHFAFTLEHNEKYKTHKDPLSVLMAVLKRGEAWVEPNYISPRERAMRAAIEEKKREQERIQKAEEELFDLEYNAWESKLSEEDRKSITTEKRFVPASVQLRVHFRETKWKEIKQIWD